MGRKYDFELRYLKNQLAHEGQWWLVFFYFSCSFIWAQLVLSPEFPFNASVHFTAMTYYYMSQFMSGNPAVLVTSNVYPAFKFLLEFVITFSMTEKAFNNSFQTAKKKFGGLQISDPKLSLLSLNFSLKNKHISTHILKGKEFPTGLYLMERRNTCPLQFVSFWVINQV